MSAAQTLADLAAAVLRAQRRAGQALVRVGQLQQALDSRVVIEQAKGVLVARTGVRPEEAFEQLRRYARDHQQRVHDVARRVVDEAVRHEADRGSTCGPSVSNR